MKAIEAENGVYYRLAAPSDIGKRAIVQDTVEGGILWDTFPLTLMEVVPLTDGGYRYVTAGKAGWNFAYIPVERADPIILNQITREIHEANVAAGWWDNADNPLIVPAKLALIHSEVSEALEGHRKGLMDDHLPNRTMIEAELADVFIRLADLAGFLEIDLGTVVSEKLAYNASRADHKPQNRQLAGGKKY